jgi:hypothetical protein
VVKVEAGPETEGHEIACRVCGVPLAGWEGKFVLKLLPLEKSYSTQTKWYGQSHMISSLEAPGGVGKKEKRPLLGQ